jgi:hypothetical protein
MSKIILFFLYVAILFIPVIGNSQRIISGRVKDSLGTPLSYVNITIKDSVEQNIFNTISDSVGFFKTKLNKDGIHIFQLSRINYQQKIIKIDITNDNLIDIQLNLDTNKINDVTVVTTKKPILERKADRYVLNIINNINLLGKNTMDLLKFAPGIFTNGESIRMADRDDVVIMINDIPVYLNGKSLVSYLNSLPLDQILRIEVISTPSAKYDASGNIGMINIVLKKNILPGILGNLQLDYLKNSYFGKFFSGNLSYHSKRLSILTLLNGYDVNYYNLTKSTYFYPNGTSLLNYNSKKWGYQNMGGQISADYRLSEKTLLNLNYVFSAIDRNNVVDIVNKLDYLDKSRRIDSTLFTKGTTSPDAFQHNISLLFDKKLNGEGKKFTIQSAWLTSSSTNQRPFSSFTEVSSIASPYSFYKTEGFHSNNIFNEKFDFTLPFKNSTISFGGKLTFIENKATNDFFKMLINAYVNDTSQSYKYYYVENTQSVYVNFNKSIGTFQLQGGYRVENSNTSGRSSKGYPIDYNYLDFFPSLFASYAINSKNNLSFSFGKRVNRPPFEFLDPFKWYINKYFYSTGNPLLKPSFVTNAEIEYLYNSDFDIKGYFSKQNNGFGRVVISDTDSINIQKQTVENYINKTSYGINFYKYYNKIDWLSTVIQIDFVYENYTSKSYLFQDKNGFGGTFSLWNTIYFTKNQQLQGVLNIQETMPGVYEFRERSNSLNIDIGFNFIFPGKQFEANIYASDITKTSASRYMYTVNNVRQEFDNYFDSRQILFTLKYRFGNKYLKKVSHSLVNEEEKNRIN